MEDVEEEGEDIEAVSEEWADAVPEEMDEVHVLEQHAASSDEGKILMFRLKPILSGSSTSESTDPQEWGWFYNENGEVQTEQFTFSALAASGEPHKVSAVHTAQNWILAHGPEIFQTIFLLDYLDELPEAKTAVRFLRVELDGDELHVVVQETQPGRATFQVLEKLRESVRLGSDTWECGDFGSIENLLFGTGIQIQLTLSEDVTADWIPALPPSPTAGECFNYHHYLYRYQQQEWNRTPIVHIQGFALLLFFFVAWKVGRREEIDENDGETDNEDDNEE